MRWLAFILVGLLGPSGLAQVDVAIEHFARGVRLYEQGEYSNAIDCFTTAIRLDPNGVNAFIYRGKSWDRKDEHDKAIADYNEAIRLNSRSALLYCNRGFLWEDKDQPDKAMADFNYAIDLDPKLAIAYCARAVIILAYPTVKYRGEATAIEDARTANELSKWEVASSICVLATAYAKEGRWNEAIEYQQKAIAVASDDDERKAHRSLLENFHKRFRDFPAPHPQSAAAKQQFDEAVALCRLGEYGKAIEKYTKSISIEPRDTTVYVYRGSAWSELGEHDRALADFSEAIRLSPTYFKPYGYRGDTWLKVSEFDRAIEDFTEAIRLKPKDAWSYTRRGYAWLEKGDAEKAIVDFTAAIRLSPTDFELYRYRGYSWLEEHEYDRAIADFNQAIKLNPKDDYSYSRLGTSWWHLGAYDKAIENYDKAIGINPDQANALDCRAWLMATCCVARYRNAAKALRDATKACELSGWMDARKLVTLAASHAEAGNFDKAIEHQRKATNLAPDKDKLTYRNLITLYQSGTPYRDGVVAIASSKL